MSFKKLPFSIHNKERKGMDYIKPVFKIRFQTASKELNSRTI